MDVPGGIYDGCLPGNKGRDVSGGIYDGCPPGNIKDGRPLHSFVSVTSLTDTVLFKASRQRGFVCDVDASCAAGKTGRGCHHSPGVVVGNKHSI